MPSTRSSARNGAGASSSPNTKDSNTDTAGAKRKTEAGSSPAAKRGRKSTQKEQKTIEETMQIEGDNKGEPTDQDMKDAAEEAEQQNGADKEKNGGEDENDNGEKKNGDEKKGLSDSKKDGNGVQTEETNGEENPNDPDKKKKTETEEGGANVPDKEGDSRPELSEEDAAAVKAMDAEHGDLAAENMAAVRSDENTTTSMDPSGEVQKAHDEAKSAETDKETTSKSTNGAHGAVEESNERKDAQPSNILEKGIIYFFMRGRVGTDKPESVMDVARSYIVLRPLPAGAALGDGAIEDMKNNRLLALPKKVLPKSGKDKFLTFVEKAGITLDELRKDFMEGSDYSTKTTGTNHTPAVTPIGEGVYAITTTGRETHLAYMLTIPSEIGDVQGEMGLQEKGSFVCSLKNPTASAPANASLPEGPEYPKEILDEFHGLRWMPMQPKHLDYRMTQVLLIGEGQDDVSKALQSDAKDEKDDGKTTAQEEMEKLEAEDEHRVEGLKGDDSIFEDLGVSKNDYPKVKTTW